MPFRIHGKLLLVSAGQDLPFRVIPKPPPLRPKQTPKSPKEIERRKGLCQTCEWLWQEIQKCIHPNCGCKKASRREKPWQNLIRCGAKKW